MRKALLPMIASLALCGAATGALIATNASAAGTPKKPVMVTVTTPEFGAPLAAPPPDGGMPMDGKMRDRMRDHMGQMCKDMVAHKVGELAYLETKLALTPAQTGAFAHWKQVSLDIARHHADECAARLTKVEARMEARKAGDREPPSIIDRMSREEEMLKNRLADLQTEKPALEALVKTLTPEQQKELGHAGMEGGPRRMMMGMMRHPGGMGPMGGPGMGPGPMGPADAPPPPPPQ